MANRGRGYSQGDWGDSMKEEFNSSHYEQQYDDEDASELVQLDHCRLYITNIPKALSSEGLRAAFAKYGTLHECYLSVDPQKRYALIMYETPGEAKLAMMKLNRTEPMKFNISLAHKKKKDESKGKGRDWSARNRDEESSNGPRERSSRDDASQPRDRGSRADVSQHKERSSQADVNHRHRLERDDSSVKSRGRRREELANGDSMTTVDLPVDIDHDATVEIMDPELQMELDRLQLQHLKLQQEQLKCKKRMLMKEAERRAAATTNAPQPTRCLLPGGKVVVRNIVEGSIDPSNADSSFMAAAGDCNERETMSCSCKSKKPWDQPGSSSEDGRSTPSTCVLCSEDRSTRRHTDNRDYQERSDIGSAFKKSDLISKKSDYSKFTDKSVGYIRKSATTTKTETVTSKKSDYSKFTDSMSKRSEVTSKKLELVRGKAVGKNKSDMTWDLKYHDFYSDTEEEADETNRLIQLRSSDYMDIVEERLKIVIALAGYPKSKMRLRQMEQFQRSLSEVIDMQLKGGLLRKTPSFLDYYLNRGAIVCICKDVDTRDWMVRVSPGLQERMCTNLILLKANVKRLCLAVLKIPKSSWPASAQDAFKLLQYFNPTLRTDLWRVYSQKTVDNVECTSFLIDRVSGEIIRGPTFKNVIDYNQMEFELTGYSEIYYECLLSDLEEDLSSVASRVKLLGEIKSAGVTPRNPSQSNTSLQKQNETETSTVDNKEEQEEKRDLNKPEGSADTEFKRQLEDSLQMDVLKKLKDVKYISENNEVIIWSDDATYSDREDKPEASKSEEQYNQERSTNIESTSGVAVSDKTESVIESNDNLAMSRASTLNIDSNRGIAYHRRTNYLHVENELKIAITLEGYPQNKLEGTHIRRLKHLFKEYLHKDMKNQRFTNLIIPKFQDIYLSNGAVIYICDSLETKDYLTEIMPKFINSTGLKLTFRDIKQLVRYTRIVMRLPKEHSHVESVEILLKLKAKYPKLKPDCWKYYSDVAGKQKRQFGVDPESLDVMKSPDFDPTYAGEKISFRIIDRQKRDISFEEPTTTDADLDAVEDAETKKIRQKVCKSMHVPIDPEIMNAPLTRIRTNHYSDLIADDLKLFVSPVSYPENRVDESLFYSIRRALEIVVCESLEKGEMTEENIPKLHDMYLFDGVIFIICQNMASRHWVEKSLLAVNSKLHIHLKSTEFRGAVGIISMVVKTDKDTDEVIAILQKQNPRLRTKYWRKISTVRSKTKLDAVLQIDKLSAQVITSQSFNKYVGSAAVQFKLGHLQSLLKPKASLEELSTLHAKKLNQKSTESGTKALEKPKSKVSMQGPKNKSFEDLKSELKKEYPGLRIDDWDVVSQREKANHKVCDLEIDQDSAKIIEKEDYKLCMGEEKIFFYTGLSSERSDMDPIIIDPESPRSIDTSIAFQEESNRQDLRKIILKIPLNILPENKDDLSIIFDLLEDKNPGLNTELWQVFTDSPYPNNGKFTILIDKQSASIIKAKKFDPTIGGEKLKFFFPKIPGLQRIASRACVSCGAKAEEFCSRCGVTPYCSSRCQAKDWRGRHKDVCHNLAGFSDKAAVEDAVDSGPAIPPVAPFRRPRSPAGSNHNDKEAYNGKHQPRLKEDSGSEKNYNNKKFMPPGHNHGPYKPSHANRGGRGGRGGSPRNFANKRLQQHDTNTADEDWGTAPAQQEAPKPNPPKLPFVSPNKTQASPIKAQASPIKAQASPDTTHVSTNMASPSPLVQAKQKTASVPLASIESMATSRKQVPKNCVIDCLTEGDVVILSVDVADSLPGTWICLSMHEKFEEPYQLLMGPLTAACAAAATTVEALNPAFGETIGFLNPEDGEWYRARRLDDASVALLDASRLAAVSPGDKCCKLPPEFEAIPEFCCALVCPAVKVGQNFSATLESKTAKGWRVSINEVGGDVKLGEGEVQRWKTPVRHPPPTRENATPELGEEEVQRLKTPERHPPPTRENDIQPIPPPNATQAPAQPSIPEVPRPDVTTSSRVTLVDMTAFDRVFVRPADAAVQKMFDSAREDVILYGLNATPLKETPHKGQVVVAKFTDGQHYRALVRRTNVKQNKYQLEFIEYGKVEVTSLENLFPCPQEMGLSLRPTMTSQVTLQVKASHPLTPDAIKYIESIKDTELILTLPSGARAAPSGSAAVLTVAKSGVNLNNKLEEMCSPEWKKIEERGGDVIETEVLMFDDLEHLSLPSHGCNLVVLEISTLDRGVVNVCIKDDATMAHVAHVLGPLTEKMAAYCNSEIGREPYLPKAEELCIAQCPPYTQWFRAVLLEQVAGAGGQEAYVLYIDYGNTETVPVKLLRKMLPEFVRGLPAVATAAKIKDFPENPTPAQLEKALLHMNVNKEGQGELAVSRCVRDDDGPGWYTVEAPALIAAINKA